MTAATSCAEQRAGALQHFLQLVQVRLLKALAKIQAQVPIVGALLLESRATVDLFDHAANVAFLL
eukprot:CAMPEP_0181516530 /NCGR_PEP_ID=MMETSP1110-20121109/64162_1 /TAXON_ID=174948 /ORGANISM="Symbiodinium sp., Strain CCMP421" /LENGTH=64 /DNA_ID=CAMNT_0023646631 /DNA_START=226 /DNA_END=420 /DNA_ORIENTATION=+